MANQSASGWLTPVASFLDGHRHRGPAEARITYVSFLGCICTLVHGTPLRDADLSDQLCDPGESLNLSTREGESVKSLVYPDK